MSSLSFGAGIRIENLMLLEALSVEDAGVIYTDFDDIEEAFTESGIEIPVDEHIRSYMHEVSLHNTGFSTAPLGYTPDDRDSGYRSALRFYGLQRTPETDAVANQVIYGD